MLINLESKLNDQFRKMDWMVEKRIAEKYLNTACFHCGDECPSQAILLEKKSFCCEGCKMVYSILHEHELGAFYNLNQDAGISQKNRVFQAYEYLDDKETISKLIDFTDGNTTRIHFHLPQIHCSSCLWLLEHLHRINAGIHHSRVDFLKKETLIVFNENEISLREVVQLLSKIGYPPVINLNDLEVAKKPVVDKSLYYKLGLAGFAFGNIMLLSFPEYLGLSSATDDRLGQIFGYLNILLVLPVLLYSGRDYFRSAWEGIKQRHLNIDVPVSLGIVALFARSVFEIISHTGAGYLDSLAGLIFFLLIGKWFQQTTYAKIAFDRDYKSYFPIAANLLKYGKESQTTLDKLKKGDHLLIRHGELIPTDGILLSENASIDYSFVSGESELIEKKQGEALYAGGRQMGALIEIAVSKKVSNSYLTQLWNDHSFDKSNQDGTASVLANKVASFFTVAILLVATLTFIYWMPKDFGIAINSFSAVLIVACPCAVALSIPFTFGNVVRLFARQGIYFKNIKVIEALAGIKQVVFDKTGTITNSRESRLKYRGQLLTSEEMQWIRSLAKHSNHPLSRHIESQYQQFEAIKLSEFNEYIGKGIEGKIDGHTIRFGSKGFINPENLSNKNETVGNVLLEIDGSVKGSFLLQSQYRLGLKEILIELNKWAKVSLISGDNNKEEKNLTPIFGSSESLHFNKKPEEKLLYIRSLQSENLPVAMIGDGLNDAGALSASDAGIVITENTSNFTPACDVIMDANEFKNLPLLFSFSRLTIRLVYFAYGIALLYNIVGLSYAVRGDLSPVVAAILMPLSSVSIVIFGVGMSTFLAYSKGMIRI